MGVRVDVLRSSRYEDWTNGGVSAHHDRLTVVNVTGPFEPNYDAPAVALVDGPRGSKHLAPVIFDGTHWQEVRPQGHVGPMHGGNYATGDSRLSDALGFYGAVAIHDRFETVAEYEALSR